MFLFFEKIKSLRKDVLTVRRKERERERKRENKEREKRGGTRPKKRALMRGDNLLNKNVQK